jgi:predicted PurR-regulated permease PerM
VTETTAAPGAGPGRPAPSALGRSPVLWLTAIGVGLGVAYLFRGLILPLGLAAAAAYLLHPLVTWAEGRGIRRGVAVAGLFLGFGVVLVAGGRVLGPRLRAEALALAQRLPSLAAEVDDAIEAATSDLVLSTPVLRRVLPSRAAREAGIERFIEGRAGGLADLVGQAGAAFVAAVLVPLFAFFILRDSGRAIAFLMDRLPPAHVETSVAVWCEIDRIIGSYLRGVALDGLAVGFLASLGLWALGVPYPLLLGAFAGVANAVPYLGPLLGAAAAGLVVLVHTHSLAAVGAVLGLFVGIKLLDDAVLQVLIIGRSVHLHPMLLLASVVAGNQALGVLGMVIAVPAVTVLQETARLLLEHRRVLAGTHRAAPGGRAGIPQYVC